ncbi:hypothetical protein ANN_02421 [Periplaneta americana]|uniref:Uncharacterized protein n=1 Tax=Periplaneta americana TaxID=6978 RepID=A0ABQ8TW76_PERAM|nr:hypothetical protein ANN_02421 [Periplaneta americana]
MAGLLEGDNEPPDSLKGHLNTDQNMIDGQGGFDWPSVLLRVQFKVCHGSLYAVMWLVVEPREFNLPTLPQRRITYVPEKLSSKYCVHSEEYLPIRTITDEMRGNGDYWWQERGKREYPEKNLYNNYFIHHKFHLYLIEDRTGPPEFTTTTTPTAATATATATATAATTTTAAATATATATTTAAAAATVTAAATAAATATATATAAASATTAAIATAATTAACCHCYSLLS